MIWYRLLSGHPLQRLEGCDFTLSFDFTGINTTNCLGNFFVKGQESYIVILCMVLEFEEYVTSCIIFKKTSYNACGSRLFPFAFFSDLFTGTLMLLFQCTDIDMQCSSLLGQLYRSDLYPVNFQIREYLKLIKILIFLWCFYEMISFELISS